MIIQPKAERLLMGAHGTADIVAYFAIMLAAQVATTYMATTESLAMGLFLGVVSILTWLIVFFFYGRSKADAARRDVLDLSDLTPVNMPVIRRRAVLALARKRRNHV